MDNQPAPTIRDLYPAFTENELRLAEENLERYLQLALQIFERTEAERQSPGADLTPRTRTVPSTHQGRLTNRNRHQLP